VDKARDDEKMTSFQKSWYTAFHFLDEYSKLDRVKTTGTRGEINPILWNIKTNLQKLVHMCGYELPTNVQNFTQKDLIKVKIFQKVLEGYFFETLCMSFLVLFYDLSFSWTLFRHMRSILRVRLYGQPKRLILFFMLKSKRPSMLTRRNVRLSNLLISLRVLAYRSAH